MHLGIFILGFFIIIIGCTGEIIYKNCEDSSFCRRCREVKRNSEIYALLPNTLKIYSDSITCEVLNKKINSLLLFKLEAIKNNTFRVQIDEKSPLHSRYRVVDALRGPPTMGTLKVYNQSDAEITVISENNTAVINVKNFQIDFYQKNILTVSINAKGLMHFEHLNQQRNSEECDSMEDTDSDDREAFFITPTDTEPNGPEAVTLDFSFPQASVFFGIPQHADSFALESTIYYEPYRLYNIHVPFYRLNSKIGMYGSVPVLYGHGTKRTAGIFWHNSAETWVDIYKYGSRQKIDLAARFMSESGIIDVFILLGPKPLDTFKQYTDLTGTTNLPQLFTLGYHQSIWNYENETDIEETSSGFDSSDISLDALWLDVEYTDDKKLFTWNPNTFPNPLNMIKNLTNNGRHLIITLAPQIQINENYTLHNDSHNLGYYVKTKFGVDYTAFNLPAFVSYLDFFNPAVQKYWSDQYQLDSSVSNDVMVWINMNEPVVFAGPEGTMAKDNVHYNNIEHRNVHNLYGHMSVMSTFDGLIKRDPHQRPFILTRSHFSGSQRYAAISMGDNAADWKYLKSSVQMCLTESVAGFSFCGADVGGFLGNPEDSLIERWYQAAIFQPFFRSHSFSRRREPWRFSSLTEEIIGLAIQKRYSYLPFWYTMFYEHEINGLPIMRPLLANYPRDSKSFEIDTQYILQEHLLICPVLNKDIEIIEVYFPVNSNNCFDIWYDIDTYKKYDKTGYENIALHRKMIPVFQRGGTIIPKKERLRRTSMFMLHDPYTLIVCLDENENSEGTLYIDDEKTYEYRQGKYIYIKFKFYNNQLTNKFLNNPTYITKSWLERVVIVGLINIPKIAKLTSNTTSADLKIINDKKSIIVHKPGINMSDNFVITLIY